METNSFFVVKERHKYWFQTQMQMGVSGIPLTDFVIFTNVTFPVLVLKVTSSSRWEDEIKPSLIAFHKKLIYFIMKQFMSLELWNNKWFHGK